MLIQTVATVSFLPFVAVLVNSIRAHSKKVEFSVLVSDVSPESLQQVRERFDSNIEFLCCDDLDVGFLFETRSYYDVLEFNSACKILAISYQLKKKKYPECLFLDPDMYAVGDILSSIALCDRDILVTPHATSPYPDDNEMPADMELVISGHINGGIVYFRNSPISIAALDWLIKQIKFHWFVAPKYGLYADQQWLSILPYFFDKAVCVLKDPSLNIGYFNLHERELSESGSIVMVKGQPALLFHFSGFSTPSNGKLTRHSNRQFSAGTEKTLAKIILAYEELLLKEMSRLKALNGDLGFCQDPLYKRMKRAEDIWGIKYFSFDTQAGFFERIGRRLDRLL